MGGQIDNLVKKEVDMERERQKEREKECSEFQKREREKPLPPTLGLKKHQSTKQYKMVPSNRQNTSAWVGTQSVPVSRAATPPCRPHLLQVEKGGWYGAEKKGRVGVGVGGRVVGKRKSFFNIFGGRGREGI